MRRMVQLVMGRLRFTVPRTSARCMLVSFRLHARVASPHPRLLGPACCKERGVVWIWVTRAGHVWVRPRVPVASRRPGM
jgi:hypothetical protein